MQFSLCTKLKNPHKCLTFFADIYSMDCWWQDNENIWRQRIWNILSNVYYTTSLISSVFSFFYLRIRFLSCSFFGASWNITVPNRQNSGHRKIRFFKHRYFGFFIYEALLCRSTPFIQATNKSYFLLDTSPTQAEEETILALQKKSISPIKRSSWSEYGIPVVPKALWCVFVFEIWYSKKADAQQSIGLLLAVNTSASKRELYICCNN